MGRRKKRFVTADTLDRYIAESFKEGIAEVAFSPNQDIFKIDIKQRKKESNIEFRKRQNRRIKKFVEKYLYIVKDGLNKPIKLIAKQVILIADVYYRRKRNGKLANKIILWASRGGGKGITVAIVLFLMMVYKNRSAVDLAGSQDQALIVYEYTRDFLSKCIPIIKDKLLDGDPLQKRTRLKNGAELKCIPNSATQVRGKHPAILAADEACQQEANKDKNVESAINMVFSEEKFLVMLLSTFHIPIGLFQTYWDEADKRGFVKYKWDVFDTTQKCTLPEHCFFCDGDDEDCKYCKGKGKVDCRECLLTEKIKEYDLESNLIGFSYDGCNGKCLKTDGYMTIENLFAACAQNDPETWQTEFMCKRPRTKGPVYDLESAWDCFTDRSEILLPDYETIASVGIDWGWSGQTSIIGPAVECAGYIGIVEEWYKQKPTMDEIISYLRQLANKYGEFVIFPDSSHPFQNAALVEAGFGVWFDKNRSDTASGVVFSKWKDWGLDNIRKYWDKRKVKISYDDCPELWEYLKIYRIGTDGKPIKKMDHGPDALLCAMLAHPFVEEVLKPRTTREHSEKRKASKKSVLKFGGKGDEKTRQSI